MIAAAIAAAAVIDPAHLVDLQDAMHEAFEALEEAHLHLDTVLTDPPPDAAERLEDARHKAETYLEALRQAWGAPKPRAKQ